MYCLTVCVVSIVILVIHCLFIYSFAVMCLKPRQIVDNLNRDVTYETYNEELDKCDYVDYGDAIKVSSNDLVVLQLNIRGLYSKIPWLKSLLNDVMKGKKPDILLICETWQNKNGPTPVLEGYDFVSKNRTLKVVVV